ncbi:carbohydrate-binding protein [Paenibacillus pinihumi]|uniref:carbohydrate-binding protein n=1 Tax=Paenibacillus pinihumi TaxID=669462 RepID=UPI001377EDE3|nr:carbohydrate-binding protein [Paenibacillus pinihumi]
MKTRRTAILIAALVLIVGISVIIYKVSSPQGEDLADPAVANTNQAEEGEPQVEEAAVEYVFQANDPRNTLKGPHTEVADCAPCSDGKQVGGLFEGSSVQFNDVEIPEAGQYIVTVYYISGDPRSFFVQANGTGEAEKYDLPEVGKNDWESVGTYEFAVELAAGKNTLLFSDGDWYSPNLDKIILRKAPSANESQNPATAWGGSATIGDQTSSSEYGAIRVSQHAKGFTIDSGTYQILYNTETGLAAYSWNGNMIAKGVYSSVKLGDQIVHNYEFDKRQLLANEIAPVQDGHGKGIKLAVRNERTGLPAFDQIYYIYEGLDYFVTEQEVSGSEELSTNYMAPVVLSTGGGVDLGQYEDNRVLIVPFDNDAWSRHVSKTINTSLNNDKYVGSEVSAIFDNASRNGLVVGSITHDTWKTGIYWSGSDNRLNELKVYGGFTSRNVTYDRIEHGAISGTTLKSPQIFVGFYGDYRDGMEAYGRANAVVAPPLSLGPNIPEGVPVGWNSWGAYAEHLSYEKMVAVSDFFHDHIQNASFNNKGNVYINMDSFWDNLTEEQRIDMVDKIRKNKQIPGSYHTPFVYWGKNMIEKVEGTDGKYTYGDIVLKDKDGKIVPHMMGYALDPTHPGTKMKMDFDIERFKRTGYEFLKLDFLTHAAMEGEHYDKSVKTGIQAYNQGMAYLIEKLEGTMFVNTSIAPLFPSQYAHARRISCDIDGSIGSTEYQLNNLTYGWWQNGTIYHYTDPDYMTLEKGETFEGSQTRVNAAVISGTVYLSSDDVTKPENQKLMKQLYTNPRINELAMKGKAFRTVEGNTGAESSDTFVMEDDGTHYLAVFNFSKDAAGKNVDLARAGITGSYKITDLWTNKTVQPEDGKLKLELKGRESKLYKITF